MITEKDTLLFFSDEISFPAQNIDAVYMNNQVTDLFIFSDKESTQLQESAYRGHISANIIKLQTAENSSLELNHSEALPVKQNHPNLITSLNFNEKLFKESITLSTEIHSDKINCFEALHRHLNNVKLDKKKRKTQFQMKHLRVLCYLLCLLSWKYFKNMHLLLKSSCWYTHLATTLYTIFHEGDKVPRKSSALSSCNLLSSKLIDSFLGLIGLYLLVKYNSEVWNHMLLTTQFVIGELKKLLEILMGSPGGLKLNYALNHTLGTFFFYHIALWKTFIEHVFQLSSNIVIYGFVIMSVPGLSFQISLCADIITFLTFHVYCIYVYAARLYRVQIYAITSLWRLFIGRKYNPLKKHVDSLQYSNNQLFVGTLGFTLLLFLLPTTFLYYIVFTLFRIIVLLTSRTLLIIANYTGLIPLYMIYLRLTGSNMIKGKVRIYSKKTSPCTMQLCASLDLHDTWITHEKTYQDEENKDGKVNEYSNCNLSVNEIISSICSGKLI